jgi:hypothetical protein
MMGEAKLFVMMIFKSWIFKVHFQLPVKFSSSFSSNFTVCGEVVRNIQTAPSKRKERDNQEEEADERASCETLVKLTSTPSLQLKKKVSELIVVVSELVPDLILITETWCNSTGTISDAFLSIKGYEI